MNTSFGFVNSGLGTPSDYLAMCKRIGRGDWDNPEDQAYFRARFDFENHNIHAFRDMLPAMAERFPEHRIILRPHPSENGDVWVEAFSDHKRVEVLREGSTIPWILASEFLIHQTCTTGAEAHLLEHPVGAYSPITNAAESVHIGNLVTPVHRSLESLFGAIEAAVADPADAVARMQADSGAALDHHFFRSSETSAAARIAAELQALGSPRSGSVMRAADSLIIPWIRALTNAVSLRSTPIFWPTASPIRWRNAPRPSEARSRLWRRTSSRSAQPAERMWRLQRTTATEAKSERPDPR